MKYIFSVKNYKYCMEMLKMFECTQSKEISFHVLLEVVEDWLWKGHVLYFNFKCNNYKVSLSVLYYQLWSTERCISNNCYKITQLSSEIILFVSCFCWMINTSGKSSVLLFIILIVWHSIHVNSSHVQVLFQNEFVYLSKVNLRKREKKRRKGKQILSCFLC
jgi:hypothetical protein